MPDFRRPKKRNSNESIDGIITNNRTTRPKISTHSYYSNTASHTARPRKTKLGSQVSSQSQRVINGDYASLSESVAVDQSRPKLGSFASTESNLFDQESLPRRGRHAKKQVKNPRKFKGMWKNRSRKFKIAFISLLVLLGAGGLLGARLYSFLNSVFAKNVGNGSSAALSNNVDPNQLKTEGDGRLNVLLLGRGGAENEAPDLTDTIMIASIDLQNQTTSLLSIPRDLWVNVNGSNTKINAAYSIGKSVAVNKGLGKEASEDAGIKTAIETVRNVAGVPIHNYVLTDYKAFRDVVNALGGVNVTLEEPIYDMFTGWKFKAGQQTMDGLTALKYARTRHGSARGDFDRSENQRKLLIAIRQKATSTGIVANPVRLNSLANAIQKNIRTDLSIDEAKKIFEKTKSMADNNIKSLDLANPKKPLVTTANVGGISVVQPVAGLRDYSKIRAYARSNMIDPFLRKESPTIAIYNGSGKEGAATILGDILKGYGYKILLIETSKDQQSSTIVVRKTKNEKRFTDRFLSVRFDTTLTNKLPATVIPPDTTPATDSSTASTTKPQPDYIIVLGVDWRQKTGPTW